MGYRMFTHLKAELARTLPPKSLYWMRSVKRAIMGEQPLPWPHEPSVASTVLVPLQGEDRRRLQDRALERLERNQIHAPFLFFDPDDVLILTAKEIARALTLSVQYLSNAEVHGDIAEFGTMGGFTARTLAAAMVFDPRRQPLPKEASGDNPFRKLQLFDSFEGLPDITSAIDMASPHVVSGAWSKGGCKILSASQLRAMVEDIIPPERIRIHEGWFADTVKKLPPDTRFAMIHFDGDLYQSTIDALVPCFANGFISRGAVLCFDDWNVNRSIPSYGERRAWAELVARFQIEASHCGDYGACGTKFIIHSYLGLSPFD